MTKFQRDDAATNKDDRGRLLAVAQYLVGRDHVLRARDRQWAWPGARRDDDVPGHQQAIADADGVGARKPGFALDHLDVAPVHRAAETAGNIPDHGLLTVDQGSPVELWSSHCNVMDASPLDFVQHVTGGDQDLLRSAAAVRAGAAEVAGLEHRRSEERR